MVLAEAADFGLFFVGELQHLVNDRLAGKDLNVGQGVGDGLTDVIGVGGFALKDDAKADEGPVVG